VRVVCACVCVCVCVCVFARAYTHAQLVKEEEGIRDENLFPQAEVVSLMHADAPSRLSSLQLSSFSVARLGIAEPMSRTDVSVLPVRSSVTSDGNKLANRPRLQSWMWQRSAGA
jgi:hypothetical protein